MEKDQFTDKKNNERLYELLKPRWTGPVSKEEIIRGVLGLLLFLILIVGVVTLADFLGLISPIEQP